MRRQRATELVSTRMTTEQVEWLMAESERLDRPVSWIVRKLIDEARLKTVIEKPRLVKP